ncbi:MAG: 3-hydroxybutyryl-CoA dehydrogenase [Bdellovibrionales bacterium]|nr:3-hydroxybutyryl-CoA dehydrogenase [Bdellovibrionales bacterium]
MAKSISSVGVIGAGQMGAGIAQVAAQAGRDAVIFDVAEVALEKAKSGIARRLDRAIEKEQISTADKSAIEGRLSYTTKLADLGGSDFVVEAIVENPEVKEKLFQDLAPHLSKDAILASNTSSISITRLAKASDRPERFIGMHFMNPVPVMELVEIIRGLQTSDETYQVTKELAENMGKKTVLAIDGPGFIVNRILCPMINEAIYLLQEGVQPDDIDQAMMLGTNHPMGPLTLADFVGLDTLLSILELFHRELGEDKYRPCPLLRKYVEAGWYGKKAGKGFYTY